MTTQAVLLDVQGEFPVNPTIYVQPTVQRATPTAAVGWKWRRRYRVTNTSDAPLRNYPFALDLGATNGLVSSKALASGNDVRVWFNGREIARTLVDWNSASPTTLCWIVIPALDAGGTLDFDVVYGNSAAGVPPTLTAGIDLPIFDVQTAGASRSTNTLWKYLVDRTVGNAGRGGAYLSSGTTQPNVRFNMPGTWKLASTLVSNDNRRQEAYSTYTATGTKYQYRFESRRARAGSLVLTQHNGADGTSIRVPAGIVSVRADIRWQNLSLGDTDLTPVGQVVILTRNNEGEVWKALYSNNALQTTEATIATATYTPVAPVKEIAFAVWPYDGLKVSPSARDDRYINAAWYTTLELTLSATVTQSTVQAEVEVYELATELRNGGGGDTTPVAPYRSVFLGNAKSASGVGTPHLAAQLNQQVAVMTDERRVEVWDSGLTARVESVPMPAVSAVEGGRDPVTATTVERVSTDWMPLTPTADPLTNSSATADTTAWTPATLSPRAWWKADAITGLSNGASVSSWANSVSGGVAAANGTGAQQPTYQTGAQNGLPAVRFDGVNDYLTATSVNLPVNVSVFFAFKTPSATTSDQRLYSSTGNSHMIRLHLPATNGVEMQQISTALSYGVGLIPTSTWQVHSNVFGGTSSRGAVNGTTVSGTIGTSGTTAASLVLGANATANGQWTQTDLGELIVIDGAVSTGDQASIEGYLAWKWGLTASLPAGHPYKTSAPTLPAANWTRGTVTSGVSATTAGGVTDFYDSAPAAFSVTIFTNTAGAGGIVEDLATDYLPVGQRENVQVGVEIRTTNVNVQPTPSIWFYDASNVLIGTRQQQADWTIPATNTWYRRLFAAAVPDGAYTYRVGVTGKAKTAGATGQYWWDTIAVNDTEIALLSVSPGTIVLSAQWTTRRAYA